MLFSRMLCVVMVQVIFMLLPSYSHARTWTNSEGRHIEAEFIELTGSRVVLRMQGKRYEVPLNSLSESDQTFAKTESKRRLEQAALEARQFMGQTLVKGELQVFKYRLSEANRKIAARGGRGWDDSFAARYSGDWIRQLSKHHDLEEVTILLGIPDDFNPAVACPIFVQWTTTNRKSHVSGAKQYWKDCRDAGWLLVSVEGSPDAAKTWSNAVFYAGIKEFFEQLHLKYPGSEDWPVATGGFSGGAKICQWMGGLMSELEGVNMQGYWLGGCNEAFFNFALEDMAVSKRAYRRKKAFISTGDSDKLVTERYRTIVEEGADDAGLDVRSEIYKGGHKRNSAHFKSALQWFLQ